MIDGEGICVAFPVPERQSLYMSGTEVTRPVQMGSKKDLTVDVGFRVFHAHRCQQSDCQRRHVECRRRLG